MVALLAMVILVGMGQYMGERFLPKYLMELGAGVMIVGVLGAMNNLLGAVYALPGGYLSDRIGHKRALLTFNLAAICGYLLVIIFPSWPVVLVAATLFLSWSVLSLPATMDLVADVLPRTKWAMGVSLHSLVRRIPMALGPICGGLLIAKLGIISGIRLSFVLAIVLALVAIVLQQRLMPTATRKEEIPSHPILLWRRFAPPLRRLLAADLLVRFCEQIPYPFVVLWVMDIARFSATDFGFLCAIEMATAMAIYIPVASWSDRMDRKPFILATFVFFSAFPLVLMFSKSWWMLVLAFVIRGLKEFGEPTRKALIVELVPQDARASSYGLYYLIRDSVVSVASLMGGVFWNISPRINLIAAFAFGALGALYFALCDRTEHGQGKKSAT
ncbi:MAG: MFS transporter [Armatimonadetes bacterium]|nr:MFS transporter [Armatimonadota bacterium]